MQVVDASRRTGPRTLATTMVLPAHPSSVRLGRHAAVAWLQFAPPGYDKDTILLLVTEALADAVEHSEGPLVLSITPAADRMRVEVMETEPRNDRLHLKMMKQLADRWGIELRLVDDDAHQRVVWFECCRMLIPRARAAD